MALKKQHATHLEWRVVFWLPDFITLPTTSSLLF